MHGFGVCQKPYGVFGKVSANAKFELKVHCTMGARAVFGFAPKFRHSSVWECKVFLIIICMCQIYKLVMLIFNSTQKNGRMLSCELFTQNATKLFNVISESLH